MLSAFYCIMIKSSGSTARVNSGPEEIPNSSSLVWFLSELFPVGRVLQSTARSTSMNHLNVVCCCFVFLLFLQLHLAVQLMLLSRQKKRRKKKIKCAQWRKGLKFHTCQVLRGASGEEVKGQSHRQGIVVQYMVNDGV